MGYEGFLFTPFHAEEEQAEAFVRATRAEPEKEAAILKAKEEAEADEEQASLKAKAGKKEPGCGSKRKAEEDLEEAPAAVDVMVEFNGEDDSEDEFYKACMADDSIDYDSDEGPDARYAKCKAWFESRMEACNARHPWLVGKGKVADADADADGSPVV